jgi:hypothetical protein
MSTPAAVVVALGDRSSSHPRAQPFLSSICLPLCGWALPPPPLRYRSVCPAVPAQPSLWNWKPLTRLARACKEKPLARSRLAVAQVLLSVASPPTSGLLLAILPAFGSSASPPLTSRIALDPKPCSSQRCRRQARPPCWVESYRSGDALGTPSRFPHSKSRRLGLRAGSLLKKPKTNSPTKKITTA